MEVAVWQVRADHGGCDPQYCAWARFTMEDARDLHGELQRLNYGHPPAAEPESRRCGYTYLQAPIQDPPTRASLPVPPAGETQ